MLKTIIAVLILYVVWDKTAEPYWKFQNKLKDSVNNAEVQIEFLKKTTPGIIITDQDVVALMVKGAWHQYVDAHAEALRKNYGDAKANEYQCTVLSFITAEPHKFQSWGKKGTTIPCAGNKNILY